jgi:hypothetical protein
MQAAPLLMKGSVSCLASTHNLTCGCMYLCASSECTPCHGCGPVLSAMKIKQGSHIVSSGSSCLPG